MAILSSACSKDNRPSLVAAVVSDGATRNDGTRFFVVFISAGTFNVGPGFVRFCGDLRPGSWALEQVNRVVSNFGQRK